MPILVIDVTQQNEAVLQRPVPSKAQVITENMINLEIMTKT